MWSCISTTAKPTEAVDCSFQFDELQPNYPKSFSSAMESSRVKPVTENKEEEGGVAMAEAEESKPVTEIDSLKKAPVDSFYGTNRGFKATSETRAEIYRQKQRKNHYTTTYLRQHHISFIDFNIIRLTPGNDSESCRVNGEKFDL